MRCAVAAYMTDFQARELGDNKLRPVPLKLARFTTLGRGQLDTGLRV